jgi:hypothetical protein
MDCFVAHFNADVVTVGGAKMAKSTGNLVLVSDLLADHSAAAVRLLILDRPWHEDWDYVPDGLDAAVRRLELLQIAAGQPETRQPRSPLCAAPWPMISTCPPRWPSPRRQAGRQPASSAPCSASGSSITHSNLRLAYHPRGLRGGTRSDSSASSLGQNVMGACPSGGAGLR